MDKLKRKRKIKRSQKTSDVVLEYDYTRLHPSDDFSDADVDKIPEEFFKTAIEHKPNPRPKWWDNLSLFKYGYNSTRQLVTEQFDDLIKNNNTDSFRTAKSCPGLGSFFNRSINLKWPCDVFLEVKQDGEIIYKPSNPNHILFSIQDQDIESHLNNVIIVKVTLPIAIRNTNFDISFNDPILYNNTPFRVCPGLLLKSETPTILSTFLMFSPVAQKYFMPAGDIYNTLVTSEPNVKLKHSDLKKEVYSTKAKLNRSFFNSNWSIRNVDNG